jgi:hypothetical protein
MADTGKCPDKGENLLAAIAILAVRAQVAPGSG